MSKEDSYLSQNNILRCPYFGLIDDVRTQSDFPSEVNCCHRCKKPECPSYAHQQEFCLTKQYSSCIMLKDTRLKSLPADVRMSVVPTTNRNKTLLIAIGVVLVALALILLISGPIKGIFTPQAPTISKTSYTLKTSPRFTNTSMFGAIIFTTNSPTPSSTPLSKPTDSFTNTPKASEEPTKTATIGPSCSIYDITYYSLIFLGNSQTQLVYDTPLDLSPYRILDAQGNPTPQLNLPGLNVWVNDSQYLTYSVFLRNPSNPKRLYLELKAKKNDRIFIELIDDTDHHCSWQIIIPAESVFYTPTNPGSNPPAPNTPTPIWTRTSTRTRMPLPPSTQTPTKTVTTLPPPTNTNTPTPTTPTPTPLPPTGTMPLYTPTPTGTS